MKNLKTFESFGGYSLEDVFIATDNPKELLNKILDAIDLDELEQVDPMHMDDVIMDYGWDNNDTLKKIKQDAQDIYDYEYNED